jgi:hypothetical protein
MFHLRIGNFELIWPLSFKSLKEQTAHWFPLLQKYSFLPTTVKAGKTTMPMYLPGDPARKIIPIAINLRSVKTSNKCEYQLIRRKSGNWGALCHLGGYLPEQKNLKPFNTDQLQRLSMKSKFFLA